MRYTPDSVYTLLLSPAWLSSHLFLDPFGLSAAACCFLLYNLLTVQAFVVSVYQSFIINSLEAHEIRVYDLIMFKRLAIGLLAAQSVAATRFAMYIDQ